MKRSQPHWPHITQLCGLYCVEETTARLVYCDSFLPITAVTVWTDLPQVTHLCGVCCVGGTTARLASHHPSVWCVLCWRDHSQTGLTSPSCVVCAVLWRDHSHTGLTSPSCVVCAVLKGLQPHWPHITQLCGLCCVEEATARLVYCDSFLPVTAVTMEFLLQPGKRK